MRVFSVMPILAFGMLLLFAVTSVDAVELRYDSGTADDFTFQLTDGYLVRFSAPEFVEPFITRVSFFGSRFGNIDPEKPPFGYVAILDDEYNKLASINVPFTEISRTPAWNYIDIDPFIVRDTFWVYISLPSGMNCGVMMGKDLEPKNLRSRTGNHASGFRPISDGKYNWMVRCEISDGPPGDGIITSESLTGPKFLGRDTGVCAGSLALYKNGATFPVDVSSQVTISKLYIFGKLAGDWFSSNKEFTVYILDADLRIQLARNYPYRLFTSTPGWAAIDLPDIKVNGRFYIIVEPNCREEVQFEIGYDGAPNKGSDYTAIGQKEEWPFDVDLAKLNWMIRVEIL